MADDLAVFDGNQRNRQRPGFPQRIDDSCLRPAGVWGMLERVSYDASEHLGILGPLRTDFSQYSLLACPALTPPPPGAP